MTEKKEENKSTGLEIAVIGMAGRFPGARNINEYWENLKNGVESIRFFTDEELEEAGIDPQLIKNSNYVKANGMLENKEYFDSSFFGYSPREAEVMDPQSRVFHECCWHALEDAGYDPFSYSTAIGVYAGAAGSFGWQAMSVISGKGDSLGTFARDMLTTSNSVSTRISHKFNLRGPSFTLFTACSTSLVTIHLACRALITGECSMALAGGVTVSSRQKGGYLYQEGMIHSPDGHCRAFDAKANGTIFGEGIGIVVLKRAKEAAAHKDNIYAIIKGTAINNDGMSKVDYTAPSVKGQVGVIKRAQKLAGVVPESIGYIETHGTGTKLGDPIEISALTRAFNTEKKNYCAIGSVKTNIGHLDIAAGAAAFIKTVLALKHRLIPPFLNFETPNPDIDFENSPFYVNREPTPWKNERYPLRAGVSAFGIGGTNAHVVLEENPVIGHSSLVIGETKEREYQLILLSAKTESALEQMTSNLAEYFKKNPNVNFADAVYTLQVGRKAFQYKRMLVSRDVEEAIPSLSSPDSPKLRSALAKNENMKVVFMFPGQGAQYVNMGWELYRTEPVFREAMDRCFEILKGLPDYHIKEILYPGISVSEVSEVSGEYRSPENRSNRSHINQTEITQPVLFVFEYALAKLLIKWGIKPFAMIGHSIGEYTAACLSGVFSLEHALKLVTLRGQLMQRLPTGAMLSAAISEEELAPLVDINEEISLAAVNSPLICVVSGTHDAVEGLENQLRQKGYDTRKLHTSHAFHSKMMDPILKEFEEKVKQIQINKPEIPYISNLTGKPITFAQLKNPGYWSNHLRRTVRFSDGVKELLKEENIVFVEVGPGKALSTLVNQYKDKKTTPTVVNLVRHPKENVTDEEYLLNKIGQLWLYGGKIDWAGIYPEENRYRISLPAYPFEGQKYWIQWDEVKVGLGGLRGNTLNREPEIADWFYIPLWEQSLYTAHHPPGTSGPLNWLIFVDEQGVGTGLVQQLHRYNPSFAVTCVETGPGFDKKGDGKYMINPCRAGDYHALFKELKAAGNIPQKIIHMGSVKENNDGEFNLEEFDAAQARGFYSLIHLVQAIGRQSITEDIQITVITNNMHEIAGEGSVCPGQATLLGAVKVIPLEYSNINCRTIDILVPPRGSRQEETLPQVLVEELTAETREIVMALRGNHRWIQRLKRVRIDKPPGIGRHLREQGVYLITGGLGGIGFSLAQYLAKTVKAKLVLTGRSAIPPGDERDKWLSTHDEKDKISLKIRRVRALEEQGADIMIVKADAADKKQMHEVITRVRERFGKINGVLHAAGVIDYGGVIQRRTQQDTENYMAAKVKGTLVLEEIFKQETLDFVILFSTVGNILYREKFGQVGYAAANEFLEAFASYKAVNNHSGTYTAAVNWPDWLEVGMVIEALDRRHKGSREKIEADIRSFADFAVSPAEGIEIFSRIMDRSYLRVSLSPQDLGIMIEHMNRQLKSQKEEEFPLPGTLEEAEPGETLYRRPELTTPYAAPTNEIEQKLAAILQRFLGIEQVGIHDDFFELGGNSLTAMSALSIIHKELDVKIPLVELFNNPFIKGLAQYITASEKSRYLSIQPVEEKEFYPLSAAQERLYFIQQIDLKGTAYNLFSSVFIEGYLDIKKLEETFRKLIIRHESLRTSFVFLQNQPVQQIHREVTFNLAYFEPGKQEVEKVVKDFTRIFDLSKAPLLRVGVIKIEKENHILMVDMHHIISDEVSMGTFIGDFTALYGGEELPAPGLRYRDFTSWQNTRLQSEEIKKQKEYWLNIFKEEPPPLELPVDFSRPSIMNFEGDTIDFNPGKEMSRKVIALARETDTTLFMVLYSVYFILLSKYTGVEDIVIGAKIAGRSNPDLLQTIGMFVNMLAIRNRPQKNRIFKEFLEEVKLNVLKAFENQDYPFQELVKKVGFARQQGRNPLFDAVFGFSHMDNGGNPGIDEMKITPRKSLTGLTNFDLHLEGVEVNGIVTMELGYSTKLFKPSTARKITSRYMEILEQVVNNKNIKLKEITISHDFVKSTSTSLQDEEGDFVF